MAYMASAGLLQRGKERVAGACYSAAVLAVYRLVCCLARAPDGAYGTGVVPFVV